MIQSLVLALFRLIMSIFDLVQQDVLEAVVPEVLDYSVTVVYHCSEA